jgi:tryptophanyl-tRNA synthetase
LKKRLLGRILETFGEARKRRQELVDDPGYVEGVLRDGRDRAMEIISAVMSDCRRLCGLGW